MASPDSNTDLRSRNLPTCWPAFSTTVLGSVSSCRSATAQPLISLATSSSDGFAGFEYRSQVEELAHLLAGFQHYRFGVRLIVQVGDCPAVDLLGDFFERWLRRIRIPPVQVQHRFGRRATLLLIKLANLQEDARNDLLIRLGLARRIHGLPLPLDPARRVGKRAVLLGEVGGRQQED